jgi:voltage-gated potassium channel
MQTPPSSANTLSLRRSSRTSAWVSLSWRVALALGLVSIALAVHWIDRDGLRDNIDGVVSFPDVIYFTMITITTVGYGDIVPVTEGARLFDAFGLTPIRLFVWLIFLGTAYDFILRGLWERWRMSVIQRNLHDHFIVAGYGVSGAEAVSELIRLGIPPGRIVVIDNDARALEAAEARGVIHMVADATRNATLEAVQVSRARTVIVSAGRDDTSILIVLTTRGLSPRTHVSVVIRSQDNEALACQAGATTVINPVSFAGQLLAGSTHGPHIADYIGDLAATHGAVALRERPVAAGEVGRALRDIATGAGLRLHRDGRAYEFWDPQAQRLEPADVIVEVVAAQANAPPASGAA